MSFKTGPTKVPMLGNAVLYRPNSESYNVGFVVAVGKNPRADFTKVPVKFVVFDAEEETVTFVSATYGVEVGQWLFSGDYGVR